MSDLLTGMVNDLVDRVEHLEALEAGGPTDAARVYESGDQPIGGAPWTVLTFDSERFDTNGLHDPAVNPSRLTAQKDGIYQIGAHFLTDMDEDFPVSAVFALMVLNGSVAIASFTDAYETDLLVAVDLSYMQCATLYELTAGDYVEVWAFGFVGVAVAYAVPNFSAEFFMTEVISG